MTVFRPIPKTKVLRLNLATFFAGLLLLTALFSWLMLYNQIVDANFTLKEKSSELSALKVEQAETSSRLARLLNPDELPDLAANHGLVQESHPQFVYAGE